MKNILGLFILCLCSTGCNRFMMVEYIHPRYSTPASYENLLIFKELDNRVLYAVDKQSRRIEWWWSDDNGLTLSRPTVDDGIMYIWSGEDEGATASAVDCRTRDVVWKVPLEGVSFLPAVVTGQVVLFQADRRDKALFALQKQTGELLWKRAGIDRMLVHDDVILALNPTSARIELLDTSSGELLQEFPFISYSYFAHRPMADCNDQGIAVIGCKSLVVALDIPGRRELWRQQNPTESWAPAVLGDDLYLYSRFVPKKPKQDYCLQCRALGDGKLIRKVDLSIGGDAYFPMQIYEDAVVVSSFDVIAGFHRRTLKELWRLELGNIQDVSTVDGKLYVGGGEYAAAEPYLWELDPISGKKIWVFDDDARVIH